MNKLPKFGTSEYYSAIGKRGGATKVPKGFATMNKKKHLKASASGGKNGKPYSKINK
jgi:hypothetical protein